MALNRNGLDHIAVPVVPELEARAGLKEITPRSTRILTETGSSNL